MFKSHSRHLSRSELRRQGLVISSLEDDESLRDLSLSVFHATTHTFGATPSAKKVENHAGRAFIKQFRIPQQAPALKLDVGPIQPNEPPGMNPLAPTG